MKSRAFTQNKSHSRMFLSGIPTLEKAKAVETPDTDARGWTNNKAFTLIELLVVVLIIGILAAIALPQYQRSVLKSRMAEVPVRMKALERAAEMYVSENGFPSSTVYLADINADLMSGLTQFEGKNSYHSNYVSYAAYCSAVQCTLSANFNTKGNPHVGAYNEDDIGLEAYFAKNTYKWTRYCAYLAGNKHGPALCKMFESLGYTTDAR